MLLKPGIHFNITRDQYVSDPGYNQSAVKALAKANTPAHYRHEADAKTLAEKDYIRIGNYVDCAVFHPALLAEKFTIWPGERRGKEWLTFRDSNNNKTILNESEHARALGTLKAILAHKDANDAINSSKHHAVAIAIHPQFGYRLKAEIDMLPPAEFEWMFDIKTADDAGEATFRKQSFTLQYDFQACFYMDILSFLPEPIHINRFGFLIAETNPPHGVKMRYFRKESPAIVKARERINKWLPIYDDCVVNNKWPGYSDGWEEITFDYWMLRDEQVRDAEVLV